MKVELYLREKHGDDTWNFSVKFSDGQAGVSPYVFTDIAFLPMRDEAAENNAGRVAPISACVLN